MEVSYLTDPETMGGGDRELFFRTYKYVRQEDKYILVAPEHLDRMTDKRILINDKVY